MAKEVKVVEEEVIVIPIDPLNKHIVDLEVTVNGKRTVIIRGKQTKVSKEVYEVLKKAGFLG